MEQDGAVPVKAPHRLGLHRLPGLVAGELLAADEAALIAVTVDPSSGAVAPIGGELVAHPHLQPGTPSC